MTDTTRDRMARISCCPHGRGSCPAHPDSPCQAHNHVHVVDSLLDVMMEPSEGVVAAVVNAISTDDLVLYDSFSAARRARAVRVARSMITAIREGK